MIILATTLFSLLALLVAIRWAGRRERMFMRDIMAPEVDAGTISAAELDALLAVAGGEDTQSVEYSRSEIARLRASRLA